MGRPIRGFHPLALARPKCLTLIGTTPQTRGSRQAGAAAKWADSARIRDIARSIIFRTTLSGCLPENSALHRRPRMAKIRCPRSPWVPRGNGRIEYNYQAIKQPPQGNLSFSKSNCHNRPRVGETMIGQLDTCLARQISPFFPQFRRPAHGPDGGTAEKTANSAK